MRLVGELFEGALDIVGDVHGEFGALTRLLDRLGYDAAGHHADGRRLVFLGDLTDRGPDSPAVLEYVARLVGSGRAQCIAGNHELNLMRGEKKHGNDWWVCPGVPGDRPAVSVSAEAKPRLLAFLHTLPLALERPGLRVVHACWNTQSIEELRGRDRERADVLDLYREYVADYKAQWEADASRQALDDEARGFDLKDRSRRPPLMPRLAECDTTYQMSNPVTVVTSGEEGPAKHPFWAGGRWRMVERLPWWERYDESVPVVVGHYWRRFSQVPTTYADKFGPDLFDGIDSHEWMGCRRNVYCVDFSVGGRAEQRFHGKSENICQLAALRVPEWAVWHDGGERWSIGAPGASIEGRG